MKKGISTLHAPVMKPVMFFARTKHYYSIDLVQGDVDDDGKMNGRVAKIDLTKFVNADIFSEEDRQLMQQVRKIQPAEINKYLNRNSPFSGFWENIIHQEKDELPEET